LYYLPLIQLTSISVIIYICLPYESSISVRSWGCHTLLHYTWHRTWYVMKKCPPGAQPLVNSVF